MTKYHISKSGKPSICRAKNSCPLGGDSEHFDSIEEAQEYADKVNSKLAKQDNNIIYDKPGKKEKYETEVARQINNIYKKLEKARKSIEKKKEIFNRPEYRGKNREEIIRKELINSGYEYEINKLKYKEDGLKKLEQHRTQTEHFRIHNKIEEISYSSKSSSTYMIIKQSNYKKTLEYLREHGYSFQTRPDLDKMNPNEKIEIRFADHKPSEYYKQDKNDDKMWSYTNASILVDYQDKAMKVKGKSELISKRTDKVKVYRGEVVGKHNVKTITNKIVKSKPNISNVREIDEDIKTLRYALSFSDYTTEEKNEIKSSLENREKILKNANKNKKSNTQKKKNQRNYRRF